MLVFSMLVACTDAHVCAALLLSASVGVLVFVCVSIACVQDSRVVRVRV